MDKKTLTKYVVSFVMGDGGVYKIWKGNGYKFVGGHIQQHEDYVNWKVSILSELTKVRISKVEKKDRQVFLRIETNTHPVYAKVRERLYVESYKSVDPHYLKLLDWEMAAILFQDDGHARDRSSQSRQPEITIAANRLSYADTKLLADAFKDRLGMYFDLNKANPGWILRLRNKDGAEFMRNIEPFMVDSFRYKWISPNVWPCTAGDEIVRTAQ